MMKPHVTPRPGSGRWLIGAVIAAAVGAPAMARDFVNGDWDLELTALNIDPTTEFDRIDIAGSGDFLMTAAVSQASASLWASPLSIGGVGTSTGASYLGAALQVHLLFTVDADGVAIADWDFTGDEGLGGDQPDSFVYVDDITDVNNPISILAVGLLDPPGPVQLQLQAGRQYRLVACALGWDGRGSSSYELVIPTPGAAALLGLGALAAGRRRR